MQEYGEDFSHLRRNNQDANPLDVAREFAKHVKGVEAKAIETALQQLDDFTHDAGWTHESFDNDDFIKGFVDTLNGKPLRAENLAAT